MTRIDRFVRCAALAAGAGLLTMSAPALADAGHGQGAAIGAPATASAATRTVKVKLGDTFYKPETIQVKPGETVRFVLANSGELLHEFNIGTAAMHAEHRKEMLAMTESGMLTATGLNPDMAQMDHSEMGHSTMGHSNMAGMPMQHDDPNSVLVEPGKTKELVWKFSRPADLEFACNIPGHYESGMVGDIRFIR